MKQKNALIQKKPGVASALEIFSNGAQKLREAGQWLLIVLQLQIIAEREAVRPDAVSAILLLNHISAGEHIRCVATAAEFFQTAIRHGINDLPPCGMLFFQRGGSAIPHQECRLLGGKGVRKALKMLPNGMGVDEMIKIHYSVPSGMLRNNNCPRGPWAFFRIVIACSSRVCRFSG